MSLKPIDLSGGKSVYCFNEGQLNRAFDLYKGDTDSGEKIRKRYQTLQQELTRNELAALAFVIIDVLNRGEDSPVAPGSDSDVET